MPLLAARVKETTTTIGTGTLSLAGAVGGFQTFVGGIGTANKCFYTLIEANNWEVGIGTVTAGVPDTLSRDEILASSSGGAALNLGAGTKDIFCDAPVQAFPLDPSINDFRLSLASGVPAPTADQTAKTTIFATPYKGHRIMLKKTGVWRPIESTEVSVAVPATTNTPFDVFGFISGTALALETLNWTNDTTRATAIVREDGVNVKSGDPTRRYLGTGRTTGVSGQTEDSVTKRFLWNYDNRVRRVMRAVDTAASWTYTINTLRQANANPANQLDFVVGIEESPVSVAVVGANSNGTVGTATSVGIGLDSTTANVAGAVIARLDANSIIVPATATFIGFTGIGRHFLAWLERSGATGTTTWYGNAGEPGFVQHGISGLIEG